METILNYNCFPSGMETFPAMDEELFEYIKRIIDVSDYYLLIIGGRYGSIDEECGKSWTEKEYDYAVEKGIPVLAFDHTDFTKLPAEKTDQDDKKCKKLRSFKKKVSTGRIIRKWNNADDLAFAVSTSLARVIDLHPRTGWERADKIINNDTPKEIERLKVQIAKQMSDISELESKIKGLEADLKQKEALESKYQAAQQVIDNQKKQIETLKKQIEALKTELERQQPSSAATTSEPQPQTEIFTVPGTNVSFKMVYVQGGIFKMGATPEQGNEAELDEKPKHDVALSDYWIGETPVTQALWEAITGTNPSYFSIAKGYEDAFSRPVEMVSWYDCQSFVEMLNSTMKDQLTILNCIKFRLPTEAEWEFAARGGRMGRKGKLYKYAGSNDIHEVACIDYNTTHPVATKAHNELGLYDMSGNVWEWCSDNYGRYNRNPQINPTGSKKDEEQRIIRGGAFDSTVDYCRVSNRYSYPPEKKYSCLGLRLVLQV